VLVYSGKTLTTKSRVNFTIFDIDIEFIAFDLLVQGNVRAIIPAIDSVYMVQERPDKEQSELLMIPENENSQKLEKFFKRSHFDLAYSFAKANNYDETLLSEISRYHGDHTFKKGDYENAIKQYIQTIGHVEPSYVIRRFLDVSQIEYLIKYLEELHNERLANKHHTALLLNCFVKQKSIEKLKEWMKNVSIDKEKNMYYTETAVKVCM